MPYELKKLSNRHRAICRYVAEHGSGRESIAKKFGMNELSVGRLLQAQLMKSKISEYHAKAEERAVGNMEDTAIIREINARKGYRFITDLLDEEIPDGDNQSKRLKFDASRHAVDSFEKQSGMGEQDDPSVVMIRNTQINLTNAPVEEVIDLIMDESIQSTKVVTPIEGG